ncbi:MAG: hypothetical protein KJN76_02465 [Eudoraea sp.]|nr:hypothetical protein [Eudoraea sp.]
MKKALLSVLLLILVLLGYGFRTFSVVHPGSETSKVEPPKVFVDSIEIPTSNPRLEMATPVETKNALISPPFVGNSYVAFKEAIGFKESSCKYTSINTLGYMGKYQFGMGTLKVLGVHDSILFMNSPQMQERVFDANIIRNKWILRKDLKKYVGTMINSIPITASGILAAAHLSGAGNVKKYLRNNGTHIVADAYGTSIEDYLSYFAGYELGEIGVYPHPKVVIKK